MAFKVEGNKLIYRNDSEILQLEPWGPCMCILWLVIYKLYVCIV